MIYSSAPFPRVVAHLSPLSSVAKLGICAITSRIVVIDDDNLVRESLCVFLEDHGFEVFAAASGKEGLNCVQRVHADLVLCDLRMPDMDGLAVLQVLGRDCPKTPVIVISGAGMIADVVEALRLGATDYLVKPIVDLAVLEHAVVSALKKSALEQENAQYRCELELANHELQTNLEVLRQDHEAGRQAQLQLLPEPVAQIGEFKFAHAIIPSLYLSGDFLDYFEIDDDHIGFYIADVSGHGAASAFITMMLKSLVNHPLREYRSSGDPRIVQPQQLLSYLNRDLLHSELGKYLTMFYGVLQKSTRLLRFANGGHFPRPLLCTGMSQGAADAAAMSTTMQFLGEGSFPVGLFDWAHYDAQQIQLAPGSRLILASDGVLELLALQGEVKDEALLQKFVIANSAEFNVMVNALRERLPGLPPDDIALFQIDT